MQWPCKGKTASVFSVLVFGICAMSAVAQENPSQDESQNQSGADAYYPPHRFYGDQAVAKSAATNTYPQYFYESYRKYSNYKDLRDGYVDVTVPQNKIWLINVAFSAECRLFDKDKDKYKKYADNDSLLIRVTATNLRTGQSTNLQPFDGNQAFCSDDSYATHKGNWVYAPFPGGNYPEGTTYRIQVSFIVFDKHRNDKLYGYIDDWTLEAVGYANGRRVY